MCSKNIACFSIKDKKVVVNKCPLTLVSFSLLLLLFLFSSLLLSYLLNSSLFSLSFLSRVAEKKQINWNNYISLDLSPIGLVKPNKTESRHQIPPSKYIFYALSKFFTPTS